MKIEIELDNYISEEEKKEIVVAEFTENIRKAFGGGEYDQSTKDRERIINNSVAKWIETHIESILTEADKASLKEKVVETINKGSLAYYIFSKPNVWDRTEYSAHKIITQAVRDNEDFIKEKVREEIVKKFDLSDQ